MSLALTFLAWAAVVATAIVALILLVLFLMLISSKTVAKEPDHVIVEGGQINIYWKNQDARAIRKSAKSVLGRMDGNVVKGKPTKPSQAKKDGKRLFVLSFSGDPYANGLSKLIHEINYVLLVAQKGDTVLLELYSPGGGVPHYGHFASELKRIKEAGIRLVVVVNKVAASGGFLAACVADEIIVAPYAVIGSIGVVMQMPNFHKLLERYGVEFITLTAGKVKRTLTPFTKVEDEAKKHDQAKLEEIHQQFIAWVQTHRKDKLKQPEVSEPNEAEASTATDGEETSSKPFWAEGDHWSGEQAKEYGLVDGLGTSADYIAKAVQDGTNVFSVSFSVQRDWSARFATFGVKLATGLLSKAHTQFIQQQNPHL